MPKETGISYQQQCVDAYEEFSRARQAAMTAEAAFQPYRDRGLIDKETICSAFHAAMDVANGPNRGSTTSLDVVDEYAKALAAWEKLREAEGEFQRKKATMDAALAVAASRITK